MPISEPMTMATDYLVAGLSFFFFLRLWRSAREHDSRSRRWWSFAFLCTAVGALTGGTTHGFVLSLGESGWLMLWKATIYALALASLCLLLGILHTLLSGRTLRIVTVAVWLKFALYALFMMRHDDFAFVIYEYGSTMLIVLGVSLWNGWRRHSVASRWIVGGILISFVAARIQQSGLSLHRNFNHNDLFHLVQLIGLTLLFRGGLELVDTRSVHQRS